MRTLRDVEIRHLVALRAVAEERSFGRAAHRLGYTQSAVSQQIAALERIVGGAVFDRPGGPKPVRTTPLGALLLSHATIVLDRIAKAQEEIDSFAAGTLGSLAVGTFQSASVRILPQVLQQFRAGRPRIELRLFEADEQDELLERLHAGLLDVSFLVEPVPHDGLDVVELLEDPFLVLSPIEQPRANGPRLPAGTRPIKAGTLDRLPLIGQSDNSCQRLIEGGLRTIGIDLNIVFRTDDNAAVQAMVRAGVGHAVMPALAVDLDDPEIEVSHLEPPVPPRTIVVAAPTGRTLPPTVPDFVAIAREVCREIHDARAPVAAAG